MVGTPKNMVFSGAAPRTAASSKRSNTVAEAPAARVPNNPAHRPWTWKSGKQSTRRSSGVQSHAVNSAEAPARSEAWVWTAPFGLPVVPEV